MISLFLDTCNHNIIISLFNDNKIVDSTFFENDNNLSEKLLPNIKDLLDRNKISINKLNRIYISIGPGSFTGIRIGVAVAKVIAWSLNIDIIPISSLEVMASINSFNKYICPLIDARRGFVYAGLYDNDLNNIVEDKYIKLDELKENLENNYEDITYVSYDKIDNTIKPNIDLEKIVLKHVNDSPINPHLVNPNYLKKTEAEEKNDNRN